MRGAVVAVLALLAAGPWTISRTTAQTVSGVAFEDRNDNGLLDPGEPLLDGVPVALYGQSDQGGAVDQSLETAPDGSFSFGVGDGCYLVGLTDPPGWRRGLARRDVLPAGTPGYAPPVGLARFGILEQGIASLRAGALRYAALGDSIATNFNFCEFPNLFGSFRYSLDLRDRLRCVAPSAGVTLDQYAVKGEHTDDLLIDDGGGNNVFRVIAEQPEMVSISIIGNDLLDVDNDQPTQEDINVAAQEILDARRNIQEAVSAMIAEVPGLDLTINSLYDNLAYDCYGGMPSTVIHREWLPIINRVLRDIAWGQVRRAVVNEVNPEFGAESLLGSCSGFDGLICLASSDGIHPVQDGYDIIREKLWEGVGGINLGPRDAAGRSAQTGVDVGFLRKVRRLHPTAWETRDGAAVTTPEAALDGDDGGAAASVRLGLGTEELRFSGFPDWYDEIAIVRVVSGVRYRTTGGFQDDLYRIEASTTGSFRAPPGHDYTPTSWNFSTPLVGGGGPNAPAVRPDYPDARLLVRPQVAAFRDVSSTLTRDPVIAPGGDGYLWPALTHEDLATTTLRVASAPVGPTAGPDGRVEIDAVWLDLYGWERPRPAEVQGLVEERLPDGTLRLEFDEVPGATRYNVYFGRLGVPWAYDHGDGAPAPAVCGGPASPAGPGRVRLDVPPGDQPGADAYILVTAHDADDVESPAGFDSEGGEIDRSRSICR